MSTLRVFSLAIFFILSLVCEALVYAQPIYRLDVISTFNTTNFQLGASENGFMVGSQVVNNREQAYIASLANGFEFLPLPTNYLSARANAVNSFGVVVGTATDGISPFDDGDPVAWIPDGFGGYQVQLLRTPATTFAAGQNRPIDGGMATGINDRGDVVGFSRIQGFQGGPSTQFFIDNQIDPIDLTANGLTFTQTVHDINENGIIVGGGLKMDLDTGIVTDLGVPDPAGGVSFTFVESYAINDNDDVLAAAARATSSADVWLTYLHDGAIWSPVNPNDPPRPFVGFYDINNLGDIAYSEGLYFAQEDLFVSNLNSLLDPAFSDWSVGTGFLANDRSILTVGFNSITGENALIWLRVTSANGDFDNDGDLDGDDVDALVMVVAGMTHVPSFDLTGDGLVDQSDLQDWLAVAGSTNLPSGNAYLYGDANLDGTVDGQDFIAWNNAKFTANAAWTAGDFNADGAVDGQDFIVWNLNKFQSADARTAAVPEPSGLLIIAMAMGAVVTRRRNGFA